MSEASESLHLWHANRAETREIAASASVSGRIIATNERWTTFVPFEDDDAVHMAMAVPGMTLHWIYFEDFGLGLDFWERGENIGSVEYKWLPVESKRATPDLTDKLLRWGLSESLGPLHELARRVQTGVCFPEILRDGAADLLALPAYQWLSPRYARDTPIEQIQQMFPEAEELEGTSTTM